VSTLSSLDNSASDVSFVMNGIHQLANLRI